MRTTWAEVLELPECYTEMVTQAIRGAHFYLPYELQSAEEDIGTAAADKALGSFKPSLPQNEETRKKLIALAVAIARNAAKDFARLEMRRRQLRAEIPERFPVELDTNFHTMQPDEIAARRDDQVFIRRVLANEVPKAMAGLDPITQEILHRLHYDRQSVQEIVDALSKHPYNVAIKPVALRQRVLRAYGKLRIALGQILRNYPEAFQTLAAGMDDPERSMDLLMVFAETNPFLADAKEAGETTSAAAAVGMEDGEKAPILQPDLVAKLMEGDIPPCERVAPLVGGVVSGLERYEVALDYVRKNLGGKFPSTFLVELRSAILSILRPTNPTKVERETLENLYKQVKEDLDEENA